MEISSTGPSYLYATDRAFSGRVPALCSGLAPGVLKPNVPVRVPNSGEIYRPGERLPARDHWMEVLANLMDGAIPIGRWKIGLDPLLGLIPGIGDLIGALISMAIVVRAVQAGIPRIAVARMVTNIAIDTFVGSIPLLGDAFDFGFKSNLKNLKIYEESLYDARSAKARHWGFFLALFVAVGAVAAIFIYGLIAILRSIHVS
jgi:hypothetical protein